MRPSLGDRLRGAWRSFFGAPPGAAAGNQPLELPWLQHWEWTPRRSAGPGFRRQDYAEARQRGHEVARATLGDELWTQLERDRFLDVPSHRYRGLIYRLRIGRRIEVRCDEGTLSPWPFPYLCINPSYPLPEIEFFAQLYLYVRDREDEVIRVAAPQPWDQPLGRTF